MNLSFELFISLYISVSLINSLRFIAILQNSWYRFDKLKDFLFYQKRITDVISPIQFLLYSTLIFSALSYPELTKSIFLAVLLLDAVSFFFHKFKRPKLNIKVILLLLIALAFICLVPLFGIQTGYFVFSYTLLFPAIFILYKILLAPIYKLAHEILFSLARIKVALHPQLKVVAITGSYGKSSTKEFISELLEDELIILKTPKNINTEIGIAMLILRKLNKKHQVLVLEMGAHRKGEIKKMCKITPPDISVLTAVDPQHLTLFGSIEKLAQAKAEILLYMKKSAKAFVNIDSKHTKKSLNYVFSISPLDMRIQTYGTSDKSKHHIENAQLKNNNLSFRLNKNTYKTNLYGLQFANNLSAAILVANTLGLNIESIKTKVQSLDNSRITTRLIQRDRGYFVLDDSYNSNPVGFLTAIDNANQTKDIKKKYLLTSGMYELGKKSDYYHRKVFKHACKTFDVILLTKPELQKYLPRNYKKYKIVTTPKQITRYLNLNLKSNDLLLIEGRTFNEVNKYFTQ